MHHVNEAHAMTISQAFSIVAVSAAFIAVIFAVGVAVAAVFGDKDRTTSDTQATNDQRPTTND